MNVYKSRLRRVREMRSIRMAIRIERLVAWTFEEEQKK
jgi:hypothetical protein